MTLDEGNHLGYAVQWFTFALILGFGYIMLVRQQERRRLLATKVELDASAGIDAADATRGSRNFRYGEIAPAPKPYNLCRR